MIIDSDIKGIEIANVSNWQWNVKNMQCMINMDRLLGLVRLGDVNDYIMKLDQQLNVDLPN